ncbi:TPA: hypothetical protein ACH3X2_007061 [Trebouxia sp. C0005]
MRPGTRVHRTLYLVMFVTNNATCFRDGNKLVLCPQKWALQASLSEQLYRLSQQHQCTAQQRSSASNCFTLLSYLGLSTTGYMSSTHCSQLNMYSDHVYIEGMMSRLVCAITHNVMQAS